MTPAAFHRIVHPQEVSDRLVRISTRLLLLSMVLLAFGVSIDFFLISYLISGSGGVAVFLAALILLSLLTLWYLFPALVRTADWRSNKSRLTHVN